LAGTFGLVKEIVKGSEKRKWMEILKGESVEQGEFSGLKDHRLISEPRILARVKALTEVGPT
jgi:hypothetical protein